MQSLSQEHFHTIVKKTIYIEAKNMILKQKKEKKIPCIISSTNEVLVRPLAEFLNIDFIATKLQCQNNQFTGTIIPPYCLGENKLLLMQEYCKKNKLPFSYISYYGDAEADIPVMKKVQYPIASNPCKKLETLARKKNWKILYFNSLQV